MKQYLLILLLICAGQYGRAQINFVKNPGFEKYDTCPYQADQITFARYWSNIIDTVDTKTGTQSEYYNTCVKSGSYPTIPSNPIFDQYPHSGNGMAGAAFYYDKRHGSVPPVPNYREYLHGRLSGLLSIGKRYCVTFYVNMMESSGYGINKIGAYLDDGGINSIGVPVGSEVTTLTPQIYTDSVLTDTANWVKIEGSFIANGDEKFITVGLFATNALTKAIKTDYRPLFKEYAYYLIDDVSVIEADLPAKAGPDNWVEETKVIQIGRVGDTTAEGLDCKWYHRGNLIDSGAIITVQAGHKGDIDTYAVVQTICGNIKTDTVLIHTVGVGMTEMAIGNTFSVYPNPSDGLISITSKGVTGKINAVLYDLLGRVQFKQEVISDNSTLQLEVPPGMYILELSDERGAKQRERLQVK